jgi:LruC domain-containing protein
MTMRTLRLVLLTSILVASAAALATTYDSKGKLTWTFLKMPYSSNYDSSGIPKAITERMVPSTDFLTRLAAGLPEQRDIRTTNPDLISDDYGANVRLKKKARLYVRFIHEGASYMNSFGFFTFQDGEAPAGKADVRETVVLPNASFHNDGGSSAGLRSGDSWYLGEFEAGTNMGFFVVANGYSSKTGVTNVPTGGPPGGDWIFYTLKLLNYESNPVLQAHTVLLVDGPTGQVVLGMEDILRTSSGCDHDFNDVVFTVRSEPEDAIEIQDLTELPQPGDGDGDGVPDDYDDHPDDDERAFDLYTPSESGVGTLVFEDSWPYTGDYDFNDLVMNYQFVRVTNSGGRIVDLGARFTLAARGSENLNGFAWALPGVSPDLLQTATLKVGDDSATTITPEPGQDYLTFALFPDSSVYEPSTRSCAYFNTEEGCDMGVGPTFELWLTFKTPQSQANVGLPPWDPFIFRTGQRGLEVHLPDHPPSSLADMSLFRTGADDSDPARGRWYLDICNLPWVLDIPAEWNWPVEGTTILATYPDFQPWAESLGANNRNWYLVNFVQSNYWSSSVPPR